MDGGTCLNPLQTLTLFPIFTLVLTTPLILGDDGTGASATLSSPILSTNHYSPPILFKPSTSVLVVVLTTTFSLSFLCFIYIKHCNDVANVTTNSLHPTYVRKNSGIDRNVLESLPIFKFGSLKGEKKNDLDCAVCLAKFEDPEVLRLLPKCKHVFHVNCVDTWLNTHSTCPLCRYKVEPEDVVILLDDAKAKCSEGGESHVRSQNQNDDRG